MNRLWISIFLGLFLCGCVAVMLPPVSPHQAEWATAKWPEMTQASLEESRVLYTARCSSCHNVVVPKEYPMDEWKKIMKKMAPKAKLNEEDEERIWRYIVTANAVPN